MIISDKDKIFLSLIRRSLFASSEQLCDIGLSGKEIDWYAVEKEAQAHAMSIAALEGTIGLENANIPDSLFAEWQGKSLRMTIKNERLMKIQDELVEILKKENIFGFVIKGSASSVLYQTPEFRALGDIDFLVRECDFEKADKLLKEKGFVSEKSGADCHADYSYKGCVVELHRYINGLPQGKLGEFIKSLFDNALCERAFEQEALYGYSFPALNDNLNAIVMLLHTQNHLVNGGIGIRHLCDWGAFIKTRLTDELKLELCPILKKIGLFKLYTVLCEACERFLLSEKFELNEAMESSDKLCDMLMLDFISNGNFGNKTPETLHGSAVFTQTTVEDTEKGTKVKVKVWKNIRARIGKSVPITQKYPILIPFAFIYIMIRYIFRVITGKRALLSPKYIAKTAKRKELYEQLEFFQSEE